jgi:uncharacterized integral membrane protein (TIGR00698 family)
MAEPTAQDSALDRPGNRALLPGLAACGAVTLLGVAAAHSGFGPHLGSAVLAMLLGIGVANTFRSSSTARLEPGTTWIVKTFLPLGIVLLGARVELRELAALSLNAVALALLVLALSASVFVVLTRTGYLSPRLAALLAVGSAICGGSAIAAASPVLGAKREETAASVSAVVIVGTVGTLVLPVLGATFGMSDRAFGLWTGLSLQQTPQVIAAAMALGPGAGEVATAVKLVRIALLVPAVFVLAYVWRGEERAEAPCAGGLVPPFLWGFLLLSCISTLSLLPSFSWSFDAGSWLGAYSGGADLHELASSGSTLCLVAAMAAIGLQTRLSSLRETGPRALVGALIASLVITTTIGMLVT